MSLHDSMIKDGHTAFRYRSYLPLLIVPPVLIALKESMYIEDIIGDELEDIWVFICFVISSIGLAIRCFTVGHVPAGTSGRNTFAQRAQTLNTTGMYSIVRNPLYLGNFIMILGVLLCIKVWWLIALGILGFFIYMERIILAEEKFLSDTHGEDYIQWRAKTPLIWPAFSQWKKPELPFSWKTVLKREYPGMMAMAATFFLMEFLTDVIFEGEELGEWLIDDLIWPLFFVLSITSGLILRFLKKHTNVLKVEGR
jgi:protein-S-isoprenylcysteine O-methyltransferase Ste14